MPVAPVHGAIRIREPELEISDELPKYWNGGHPFSTHLLNALSSTFEDGEAFFVRSVRYYANEIDDPGLRDAVRAFGAQEGIHAREHGRHTELLLRQGYTALASRNRMMARFHEWFGPRAPKMCITSTAAIEHLTALLARRVLEDDSCFTAEMDPRMARLWQWHALEEAEHKAVAFDVADRVSGSYSQRVFWQLANSISLVVEILDRALYMLWKDGLVWRRDVWAEGMRFLFASGGLLRGFGRDYRAWYRRDFHPNQIDDRETIAEWHRRLFEPACDGAPPAAAGATR